MLHEGNRNYLDIIIESAIVIAIPLQQLEGPLILKILKLFKTLIEISICICTNDH